MSFSLELENINLKEQLNIARQNLLQTQLHMLQRELTDIQSKKLELEDQQQKEVVD